MSLDQNASLPTPEACSVDFCIIPIGTNSVSIAKDVADVELLLQASGLKHHMHSAGTTVEGSWDAVMTAIGQAHTMLHKTGVVRVHTSMRAGSRTDKAQTAEDKVKRVESLLADKGI